MVLDLTALDRIGEIDAVSGVIEVESGVFGPDLEAAAAEHGLTVGHFPQSHRRCLGVVDHVGGIGATMARLTHRARIDNPLERYLNLLQGLAAIGRSHLDRQRRIF